MATKSTNEPAKTQPDAVDQKTLMEHYERSMYHPLIREYYGDTDFHNWGYWEADTSEHRQASENLMKRLLAHVRGEQHAILDVACGKGATTQSIKHRFPAARVVGINIGGKQLDTARQKVPDCEFLQMDAVDLKFDDATFDTVIAVEAAFHFDTRADFLREAHRVLKPGGRLVLTDILVTLDAERQKFGRTERNFIEDPAAYEQLLTDADFREVDVQDVTEQCWRRFFWGAVNWAHRKFLAREITQAELEGLLELTYKRVPETKYYLLVAATR